MSAFPPQNSYGELIETERMMQSDQQPLLKLLFLAGLYDMMGNTWEWTSTKFPGAQPMYVLRGASWIDTVDGSANHRARVTTR